jgi:hypothetical protein
MNVNEGRRAFVTATGAVAIAAATPFSRTFGQVRHETKPGLEYATGG